MASRSAKLREMPWRLANASAIGRLRSQHAATTCFASRSAATWTSAMRPQPTNATRNGPGADVGSATRRLGLEHSEHQLPALGVDLDAPIGLELALEQLHRQGILDAALEGALERPRAEVGIVAFRGEQVPRAVGEHQLDAALGQHAAQTLDVQIHDLANLHARERMEDHDLVHAVQELW